MKLTGNTILITGGSEGIGLALAERFLARNNTVVVCGRSKEKLQRAKERFPELRTICCDVSKEEERIDLLQRVQKDFSQLNIFVNNAGIQCRVDFSKNDTDWQTIRQEIAINLEAPIHFSRLLVPFLSNRDNAMLVFVTSNLAFLPPIWVPVYGATKAGMHSFVFSLREQLHDSGIEVVEILPPAVNTNLGGAGKHTFGMDLDEFGDFVFAEWEQGRNEIMTEMGVEMSRMPRDIKTEQAKALWQKMKAMEEI